MSAHQPTRRGFLRTLTAAASTVAEPFLYPEYDWEKRGFTGNTTVANGLVHFKGQWLLYYGAADRVIGLAICTSGR